MGDNPLGHVTLLNTWLEPGIYKPLSDCGCTLDVIEWDAHGMRLGRIRNARICSKGGHVESDFVQVWNPVEGQVA